MDHLHSVCDPVALASFPLLTARDLIIDCIYWVGLLTRVLQGSSRWASIRALRSIIGGRARSKQALVYGM